jgi:hypothetical protein
VTSHVGMSPGAPVEVAGAPAGYQEFAIPASQAAPEYLLTYLLTGYCSTSVEILYILYYI